MVDFAIIGNLCVSIVLWLFAICAISHG